jgi:omega-hydroxy-beta-dihydromenaquinone-9 sulfotransferase
MTGLTDQARSGRWPHPFRVERPAPGLVYLWHGMRLSTWLKLLGDGGFDVSLNCLPRILTVTMVAPVVSALGLIGQVLYRRKVAATTVAPPIFIIGHWRTGTTLVHELLARDPSLGYPTTHQCFFPETFLVSGGAFNRLYSLLMPDKRPFDDVPVGLDRPQEEEFGLVVMGAGSLYRAFAFPRHGPGDPRYLDLEDLSDNERRDWEAAYLTLVKRVQLVWRKPLVLKSPPNTARIETLIRLFPGARFIHLCRNPFEIYPSTVHMLKGLMAVQGLQNPPEIDGWIGEYVLSTFERMFLAYERDRHLIPDGCLAEVRYEDLIVDPKGVLARVYRDIDLGDFAAVAPAIDAYLAERAGHRGNRHALDDDERCTIATRWRSYFDRFGYSADGAVTSAAAATRRTKPRSRRQGARYS